MSYDLLIKNGTVVDGTGAKPRRADVAIADGKVAEIGQVTDSAKKVIDASDLIVAPGFIDPHTHYDAQICWDPYITSSSWHGVTSVIMGNCGVGIAPCREAVRPDRYCDRAAVRAAHRAFSEVKNARASARSIDGTRQKIRRRSWRSFD